jgi:hypothetical protein
MASKSHKVKPSILPGLKPKESWEDHWDGMPEFKNKDIQSHRSIIVHFRSDEDVERFAKKMRQKISPKVRSIWYPYMAPMIACNKRYYDEGQDQGGEEHIEETEE